MVELVTRGTITSIMDLGDLTTLVKEAMDSGDFLAAGEALGKIIKNYLDLNLEGK
jgi:hypothetical protein